MRIGTWNLDARCTADHLAVIDELHCDVWLLTEVPLSVTVRNGSMAMSVGSMRRRQSFAAVWSPSGGSILDGPTPSTAAMEVDGVRVYSSVLPWRACGSDWTWFAGDQAERTVDLFRALDPKLARDAVWGGDWNQSMIGPNHGGTVTGRVAIDELIARHKLTLATRYLPHRIEGMYSIDHVAAPDAWTVVTAQSHPVPRRLSEHDAYVVEVFAPRGDREDGNR